MGDPLIRTGPYWDRAAAALDRGPRRLVLCLGLILLLGLGCAEAGSRQVQAVTPWWAPSEPEVRAIHEGILAGLASPDCAERRRVVLNGRWFVGLDAGLQALEAALRKAPPEVQRRAGLVLGNHKQHDAILNPRGPYRDWWVAIRRQVDDAVYSYEPRRARRLMPEMLRIARDPTLDFARRLTGMIEFVKLAAAAAGRSALAISRVGLPDEVLALLRDPDPDIRGLPALAYPGDWDFPPDQERLITENLIQLLRHPEFGLRDPALMRLRERTPHAYEAFCVDPTDDPRDSEPAIRQWEERWEEVEAQENRPLP